MLKTKKKKNVSKLLVTPKQNNSDFREEINTASLHTKKNGQTSTEPKQELLTGI